MSRFDGQVHQGKARGLVRVSRHAERLELTLNL